LCELFVSKYTSVGIAFPSKRFAPKGVLLYTNNLSYETVGKIHKLMTYKVEPFQIPFVSIVAFVSHIQFYQTTGHISFRAKVSSFS
jgi:hypothetical protein